MGHGTLTTPLSRSAALTALTRALETERPGGLLVDSLGLLLAGEDSFVWDGLVRRRQQLADAPNPGPGIHLVHFITLRARYFDDEILGAVARLREWRLRAPVSDADGAACNRIQVVLLGAGLDARPWRLPWGPDVWWFEVDTPEVVAHKRTRLDAVHAQRDGLPQQAPPPRPHSQNCGHHHQLGSGGELGRALAGEGGGAFPLRVAGWADVPADLHDPSWLQALEERGWRRDAPTIWVAEGLSYYLDPPTVDSLLSGIAAASAPHSVLIASACNRAYKEHFRAVAARHNDTALAAIAESFRFFIPDDPAPYDGHSSGSSGVYGGGYGSVSPTGGRPGSPGANAHGSGGAGVYNTGGGAHMGGTTPLYDWLAGRGWELRKKRSMQQIEALYGCRMVTPQFAAPEPHGGHGHGRRAAHEPLYCVLTCALH